MSERDPHDTRSDPGAAGPQTPGAPAPPAIPLLADDASPEQKDRHWFDHVYQGDRQPQLTLRAVLVGGLLGMFMSISNLYTTLKLGWAFGVAITSCVLSYVLWNGLVTLSGNRLSRMSILENNCMQSTASSAGYSTGATVGLAFAALLLITGSHQPWQIVVPFVFLTAALGVFLSIPMKRQMINYEKLPFPSGIAAAETLRSLYSKGDDSVRKARSLLAALGAGGVVGFLRTGGQLAEQLRETGRAQGWLEALLARFRIPEEIPFAGWLAGLKDVRLSGLSFEPGVLMIGAGMIMGLRVALSMLAASVVLYYVLTPLLLSHDAAHLTVAGHVRSLTVSARGSVNPVRWAIWCGTAVMVFSSLTSVALQWRVFARAFSSLESGAGSTGGDEVEAIEVPSSWLVIGLVPITIGMVALLHQGFGISIGLGLVAVTMSFVVSLVCSRATGETDTTPAGATGKLTQLVYAVLPGAAGNTVINLMAAGATTAAGSSSADLLTDLKSGYLLGANPKKQFLAQFIGIFFGTLAVVPAWYLMVPTKEALQKFPMPATAMWKAVADLLTQGVHMLPHTALYAIVAGAIVGVAVPLVEHLFPRARRFVPSAMGLGLGLVVPLTNSLAFAIGALIAWGWTRLARDHADTYNVPVASGFVAGESLVAALIAIGCSLAGFFPARVP
ncbi:MAG: OPT/YSL family transporter [Candidatus Riflebacteria bacterium]|nr:OPT/YSL family transporter [Candidatus Riflebacteria bacterium]